MRSPIDQAYWERNQLVRHLTFTYLSWFSLDSDEEPGWRHVVYVDLPTGQASWHIGDDEFFAYFNHLQLVDPSVNDWDGHTTDEKYERLRAIND